MRKEIITTIILLSIAGVVIGGFYIFFRLATGFVEGVDGDARHSNISTNKNAEFDTTTYSGVYNGKNLYFQIDCFTGKPPSIIQITVNGEMEESPEGVETFEIDFKKHKLQVGDEVSVILIHRNGRLFKCLNKEVLEIKEGNAHWNFSKYLNDPKTSKLAKDIFNDNEWNLDNDDEALALLDSLTAKNKTARPFYFKVVTKTYKKSDGYFSEGLGAVGKRYIEQNTEEFLDYFLASDTFTDKDLETWANIVILEFAIREEGEGDKIVDVYVNKLKYNCKNCNDVERKVLDDYSKLLQSKWQSFLKNKHI